MSSTERRTLTDHIADGLDAVAGAALRAPGADPAVVESWRAGPHEFVVEATADQRNGRVDTRSVLFSVTARHPDSPIAYEVARVRARDLVDVHGQPVDARATARDLLVQLAPVPDDASSLTGGDQ